MVEVRIPFVVRRGNSWRYRRRPPPDVLDKLLDGKDSWITTWRPGTPLATVEHDARKLCAQHDQEIRVARGEAVTAEIQNQESLARKILAGDKAEAYDTLAFILSQGIVSESDKYFANAAQHGGTYHPETFSLTKALERDRKLYSGDTDMRPFHYAVKSFVDLIGDKDVIRITRADASEWLAGQRKEGLAPATIQRRFGTLKALVNRALLDLDHPGRNPFDGHKITGGKGGPSDRLPFNKDMLDLLDAYLASERAGYETVNILRIMRNTGGGPAEIGGLAVADLSLGSEVPYLWIRHNALRRIKASVRDRQVPLVADAFTAAQDALERAKERTRGENPDKAGLFPSFDLAGRAADSISAKLNKAIRAAGIPRSPRLTAYSLRHTLKEAMRSAGVLDHIQRRVLGHAGHGVADTYGSSRVRLSDARDAILAALDHLGDVDDSIYSEAEQL